MKKVKIVQVIFLFFLSFLWHNIYKWFPNSITAVFFPVNESIWEHMKIIYGCFVFGSLLELMLLNKFKIKYNNFYIEMVTKAFLGVIFYLVVFIPVYKLWGENLIFSIGLMLVTYILMEFVGIKILKSDDANIKWLPIILIALGFILFGLLTIYPRHNFLFFDFLHFIYGRG